MFLSFFYEISLSPSALDRLTRTWGLVPTQLMAHPATVWVTIFTAMFLHGGWFHILSNMWVLFIFGDNIEDRLGGGRYLVFYLLSGVVAGLFESFVLQSSNVPMIGASGAIAGVLGSLSGPLPACAHCKPRADLVYLHDHRDPRHNLSVILVRIAVVLGLAGLARFYRQRDRMVGACRRLFIRHAGRQFFRAAQAVFSQ